MAGIVASKVRKKRNANVTEIKEKQKATLEQITVEILYIFSNIFIFKQC